MTPKSQQWWAERVKTVFPVHDVPHVQDIIYQSGSGSCAFLARLSNDELAWSKALGNPQGDQTLATELICSHIGSKLGVSVVDSFVVDIPQHFQGRSLEDPSHHTIMAGPAYASRHISFGIETDSLVHGGASQDVLAGLCLLWDLLLGGDEQWLYTPFAAEGLVSFDHSLWLTRGEGDWDTEVLQQLADRPWPLESLRTSLAPQAIQLLATRLRTLEAQKILEVLHEVPVEWGVPVEDLATLGWFIYRRRQPVAERLEAMQDA